MGAESRESRSMGAGILSISIALVACVVLAQQNAEYFAGFGWALIHGVGLLALRALFPFFIGLAAVGLAFAYLRQRVLAFAAACVAIVGVNETMLARTPAKKAAAARSAAAVEVRNVRDEVFRTPQGNPIGIRILFEAVFPETGVYSISPTGLVPVGMEYPPPEIAFDHLMMPRIEPEPGEKDYHDVFETGVVYAFAYDFMPSFVSYHEITKPPCFAVQARYTFSREDFEAAMLRYRTARYRTQISVRGGEGRSLPQKLWDYETSAEYDLVAMRETAEREGAGHCKEEHSFPKVKRLMTNY